MNSVKVFPHQSHDKRGFILVATLLMLLLLSILTVSMSKNTGLQELVTGNHREKTRAFESAEAALNYAESWLNQGNASTGANCAAITSTPVVCSNALANPTTLPWTAGVTYTLPTSVMTISTTGGVGSYYAVPMFYIQYLPPGAGYPVTSPVTTSMYQITAYGQGGDAGSVAVIQSIFKFCASSC